MEKVFQLANVRYAVMTNIPYVEVGIPQRGGGGVGGSVVSGSWLGQCAWDNPKQQSTSVEYSRPTLKHVRLRSAPTCSHAKGRQGRVSSQWSQAKYTWAP